VQIFGTDNEYRNAAYNDIDVTAIFIEKIEIRCLIKVIDLS